jgi:hypothetical protein
MHVLALAHCVLGRCAKAARIDVLMATVGVGHNRHSLVRAKAFPRLVQAMSAPAELRRWLSQLAALLTDAADAPANAMFVLEHIVGRHLTFPD